ncbi:hypothetical protein PJP14_29825, partial [Mycobacterium kansasii]
KTVQLGTILNPEQRSELLTFLRRHRDVFAWSHADMTGISPNTIVHRLNVNPDHLSQDLITWKIWKNGNSPTRGTPNI